MSSPLNLTIAIPTFNRNNILLKNLSILLEIIDNSCHVLIVDNCSDIPVAETLTPIIKESPFRENIRIIRNRVNIGGNANLLRCLEYSNDDYVWILGDDDIPDRKGIRNIFSEINTNPDAIILNMYAEHESHVKRSLTKRFTGACGYLKGSKFYGELIFVSSLVFKRKEFLKSMSIANGMQSSMTPQLFLILLSLGKENISVFSKEKVVTNGAQDTPKDQHASSLVVAVGLASVLDYHWNDEIHRLIKSHLINLRKIWLTPTALINQLLIIRLSSDRSKKDLWRRMYSTLNNRLYSYGSWWNKERVLFRIGYFVLLFPKLGSYVRSIFLVFKRMDPRGTKISSPDLDRF